MLHEKIKTLRQQKGFTQETLAIQLNVVRQTVSKWEKGLSVPDAEMLQQIAEVLEVPLPELLGAQAAAPETTVDETAMQLSRINEQLAVRNRRSRLIWKSIAIVLGSCAAVTFLLFFLFAAKHPSIPQQTIAGHVQVVCTLDGEESIFTADYAQNNQIITLTAPRDGSSSSGFSDWTGRNVNQFIDALKDDFTSRGGKVDVSFSEN